VSQTKRRPRVSTVDGAVAVALTLAGQAEIWVPGLGSGDLDGSRPIVSATTLAITASLALRRTAPLFTVATASFASAAQGLLTTPSQSVTYLTALLLVAYSVAAYSSTRTAAVGAVCLLAAIAAQARDLADWAFALAIVGGAWSLGLAMHRREAAVRLLDRQARALERERDEAAAAERARIARELHDIVSHRVTTMVVQAQAAETVVDDDPAAARTALQAIDEGGRAALGELRALLGLLRSNDAYTDRAPQPALDELGALIEEARRAGVPAELRIEGAPLRIAPSLELTLYRIAQEALTNVAKHARCAPTEVVLRYCEREVELSIRDAGPGPDDRNGHGHGLIGMQERVAVYGGSLEAGPHAGGGFRVVARLPLASGT
jgi:signal transduction histidine kinase